MSDPVTATDSGPRFLELAGRRVRHQVLGRGDDAVVLVHGFGGRLEDWAANQAPLAASGFRVAALDLPGHGESSVDVGSGSLDELASFLLTYLDGIGIGQAHLVGHSNGAAVCLALTDVAPRRVRSLTLIAPAGVGRRINAEFIRGYVAARSVAELRPLVALLYADPGCVTGELLEEIAAYKQRPGVSEALAKIAASRYAGTPSGRQLRDLAGTVPTLVIWGLEDAVIPPPTPGEFARDGAWFHVLPRCGHMVQVEAADEVNRLVGEFLRRCD